MPASDEDDNASDLRPPTADISRSGPVNKAIDSDSDDAWAMSI